MYNCYDILGVEKNASQDKIKKRFRELTLQYHPDKSKSGNAHDKFLRIKLAYDTLSDPEKRRLHDIQIYGIDESYTEASTPYRDTGFTEEKYEEIFEATKVHLSSLGNVISSLLGETEKWEKNGSKVDMNDFANTLLEWYHDIDDEVFSHCQRISLMFPDTHDVLIKEIKKIRKICGNHVKTITKEAYPRLLNIIKKGGSLSPNQNSKYSTTTDFGAEEITLIDNYGNMWMSHLREGGEVLGSLVSSPNPKKLGRLVTKTIDYPKLMQMTVSFIDDWIDILTLKYYQKMDLQKKLKQPKEEQPKEEPKDHVVTFADILMEENR